MQIGASPSEYTTRASNQQNNQLIGKLPNWTSRLGAGTAGGGGGLNSLNALQTPLNTGSTNNLGAVIRALLSKQGS
jgi:hypothetical protein